MSYQMLRRSFFFTFLILLVSACGGGGGSGDDNNNTTTPTNGLPEGPLPVVFMANDATAGGRGVYRALDDGSSLLRIDSGLELLPNQPLPRDFKVSPNREWVAILASDVGSVEVGLYIASMDGGTPNEIVTVTLTGPRTLEDYVWSPTGDALAYVVDQDIVGVHEVYFAMADGSATNKISSPVTAFDNRDFESPVWSPDGRYVMFKVHSLASGETEGIEVHDRHNPTAAATEITTGIPGPFEFIQNLQWSPDSSRIAFIYRSPMTSTSELWSSLANGTSSSQINPTTTGGTGVVRSDWSPDGSEIAYISRQRNTLTREVYVAGADGSSPTIQHTPFSASASGARDVKWSPDGAYLAYTSNHMVIATSYQLYVVTNRTDNRDAAVLQTNAAGNITKWEWMPDSSSIVYLGTSFSSVARIYRKDALELHSPTSPPDFDNNLSATTLFNSGGASNFELSPDSKNIAFLKFRGNSGEDELNGNPTAGNNDGVPLNAPFNTSNKNLDVYQWSPAGDRVMHAVTTRNTSNVIQSIAVYATDPDGSNRVLLSGSFNAVLVGGRTRASY